MAAHSSVLAWRVPGTGEPGGLPFMGSHRVGHEWSDLAAALLVPLSCPTLCSLIDCSPPGPSAHGSLQGRILEWVVIPFSRRSSWPRNWTRVSCLAGRFFMVWATRGRMDACVYKAESLCSAPETITALLVAYIPVQNKKKKKDTVSCIFRACNQALSFWSYDPLSVGYFSSLSQGGEVLFSCCFIYLFFYFYFFLLF